MAKVLTKKFLDAATRVTGSRILGELALRFAHVTGLMPPFAVRKDIWFGYGAQALQRGDIDPLQFAIMTSAMIGRHKDSKFDRGEYLRRVINLYNDPQKSEQQKLLEFIQDVVTGSDGRITQFELTSLLWVFANQIDERAKAHAIDGNLREETTKDESAVERTYSAIEKRKLWPLMAGLADQNIITHEQVALTLAVNLHSRERRRSGGRYLDHPMAVAGIFMQLQPIYMPSMPEAQIVAGIEACLMHDTGEKSNYKPRQDYTPLMPEETVDYIDALHKKENQTYFDYIQAVSVYDVTTLAKLSDLYHNSSDSGRVGASFKQRFVYPIAAAYLKSCIQDPKTQEITVRDYAVSRKFCDKDTFNLIEEISNNKKQNYSEEDIAKLGPIQVPRMDELIPEVRIPNANARRDQEASLHI